MLKGSALGSSARTQGLRRNHGGVSRMCLVHASSQPQSMLGHDGYSSTLPCQQRGAAIDLAAVAVGGSEEALEWAVAALEAAGQPPQVGARARVGWAELTDKGFAFRHKFPYSPDTAPNTGGSLLSGLAPS